MRVERRRSRDAPAQAATHDKHQRAKRQVSMTVDQIGRGLAQMLAHALGSDDGRQLSEVVWVVWYQDEQPSVAFIAEAAVRYLD
jgi:hypothetical protein